MDFDIKIGLSGTIPPNCSKPSKNSFNVGQKSTKGKEYFLEKS
jgi:hypothetical protein